MSTEQVKVIAETMDVLITTAQLNLVRTLANRKRINAEAESLKLFGVIPERLTKGGGRKLIAHLQQLPMCD